METTGRNDVPMKTILIVDDDLSILEILTFMLEEAGYLVVSAWNGQQALASLAQARPDMVLSDIMMPIMGGREVCRRMQADPEFRSIPVVLMSSAYNSINVEGCNHVAFLSKPFELNNLLMTVTQVIGIDAGLDDFEEPDEPKRG
jgi:CheY-like chemotaxis protein